LSAPATTQEKQLIPVYIPTGIPGLTYIAEN